MKNSTACCDYARDNRDGHVTAELANPYTAPLTVGDEVWENQIRKLVADMDIEQVHDNYTKCLEMQMKRDKHSKARLRELAFIEIVLGERIIDSHK